MKYPQLFILILSLLSTGFAVGESPPAAPGEWWNEPYPSTFEVGQLRKTPDFIRVQGNKFVDGDGDTFIFRGVNISDPDKLLQNGHWNKKHFEMARSFGANVLRIPVHPVAWRKQGKENYFELLDQAVRWANELDLYLIIDWHSIGNLETGVFQHPMYNTSKAETLNFWRSVAHRYQNIPTVAVYEIFNEPTDYVGQLGKVDWDTWKAFNEQAINIIYAHDRKVIPLVAGFNWAYDLTPVANAPIAHEGVAYAAHPYPQKADKPWPEEWEKSWGFVADTYPIIATEIGFMRSGLPGAHIPVIDDTGTYGPTLIKYFDRKGISWTVWCFDPDWPAQMISDWNYTPTEQGRFFRKVMLEKNDLR